MVTSEEERHRLMRELQELRALGEGLPPDPEGAHRMAVLEQALRGARPCEDLCCRRFYAVCAN